MLILKCIYVYKLSKLADSSQGWSKESFLNSYRVLGKGTTPFPGLLHSPLIHKCWVLSKDSSSIIFWVFCMTWPAIELRSPNIGIMVKVFTNGPGDWSSIPIWVILKTQKKVLDALLLNTQYHKVWIKGEWSNLEKGVALSLHFGVVAIKKGTFESPSTAVSHLILTYMFNKFVT